jgi:RNA recognition motif-containing protein
MFTHIRPLIFLSQFFFFSSAQTLSVRYEAHVRKGERAASSPGGGKAARVIVRNLNFKATEVELAQAFVAFGRLREVHIPTVSMPKHFNPNEFKAQSRGFGFVQFLLANDAMTAAAAAAKTPVVVCGRAVTVAMAQAKKAYDASGGDKSGEEKVDGSGAAAGSMDDDSGGEDEETKGDDNEEEGESGAGSEEEDEDDDMSDSDGSGVSDSEDDDDKDDEAIDEAADEEAELAAVAKAKLEADIAEARAAKKKAREDAGAASKDVKEGRTVFVKSLPFDAAEESLRHR